jgi:hypothetical protein
MGGQPPQYPQQPGQYPQQPGYQQPGQYPQQPGGGYAPAPKNNGMAIASLVLGILWICSVGSILAVIFGYMAKKQIKETGEQGDGMATAGIVLGWIGIGFLILYLIGLAVGFATFEFETS